LAGHGTPEASDEHARPGHGELAVPPGHLSQTFPADATPAVDSPFGASLEPVLRRTCKNRLSGVSWFRTDWQRGGALTGFATYLGDEGDPLPVVVKLPVPPGERLWMERLQNFDDVVPRLYAHGDALNGYDMAWVVMERLPHGPLGQSWDGKEFDLLIEAAGRFYVAAREFPLNGAPPRRDWEKIFHEARENILKEHDVAHEQRWKAALKKVHRKLRDWVRVWNDRPADHWCHGDLHLANAMTRCRAPGGPAVLLDFAITHAGHWVEDAIYFEHLFWARRHRLGGRKLCSLLAHERKRLGLKVEPDWPRLASVRRALMAMTTPAILDLDGDRHHVEAALEVLEIEVGV
jgi:hypothetical protein